MNNLINTNNLSTSTSTSLPSLPSFSTFTSDPKEWGPMLWNFMHTMAANYPAKPTLQDKESAKQFFISLKKLLPCEVCRDHYTSLLLRNPPQIGTSESLQIWVLWLHNEINRRLGNKPQWTLEQLKLIYVPSPNSINPVNIISPPIAKHTVHSMVRKVITNHHQQKPPAPQIRHRQPPQLQPPAPQKSIYRPPPQRKQIVMTKHRTRLNPNSNVNSNNHHHPHPHQTIHPTLKKNLVKPKALNPPKKSCGCGK